MCGTTRALPWAVLLQPFRLKCGGCFALSRLGLFGKALGPRALPWAVLLQPFRLKCGGWLRAFEGTLLGGLLARHRKEQRPARLRQLPRTDGACGVTLPSLPPHAVEDAVGHRQGVAAGHAVHAGLHVVPSLLQ